MNSIALKYYHKPPIKGRRFEISELMLAGNDGLVRAIEKFEPSKGNLFSTYAYVWIRSMIQQYITKSISFIRVPSYAKQQGVEDPKEMDFDLFSKT